jgi:hypothetical protein
VADNHFDTAAKAATDRPLVRPGPRPPSHEPRRCPRGRAGLASATDGSFAAGRTARAHPRRPSFAPQFHSCGCRRRRDREIPAPAPGRLRPPAAARPDGRRRPVA